MESRFRLCIREAIEAYALQIHFLILVMLANNENWDDSAYCRNSRFALKKSLMYTDVCWAPGYIDINKRLGVDLLTFKWEQTYGLKRSWNFI